VRVGSEIDLGVFLGLNQRAAKINNRQVRMGMPASKDAIERSIAGNRPADRWQEFRVNRLFVGSYDYEEANSPVREPGGPGGDNLDPSDESAIKCRFARFKVGCLGLGVVEEPTMITEPDAWRR
jgi:hypothetical protein